MGQSQWNEDLRRSMGDIIPSDFTQHATRATDYLFLTAIYRVGCNPSSTMISAECTAAARESLHEHTKCITLLISYSGRPEIFEVWVNGGLILFPFLPFNVIFCSIVETGNLVDLKILKELVDALERLSQEPHYSTCAKQLQIFRALYTVAMLHSEFRSQLSLGDYLPSSMPGVDASQKQFTSEPAGVHSSTNHHGTLNEGLDSSTMPPVSESQPWVDLGGMELDPFGTQLGYWIQDSSQVFDSFNGT